SLPDRRAAAGRSQEPRRPHPRVPQDASSAGLEAADGHRREGFLQRAGRLGAIRQVMAMPGVNGFMYPNEVQLQWSVLIVLYPYITGLVAGAFILASLVRIFHVEAVRHTYRLA